MDKRRLPCLRAAALLVLLVNVSRISAQASTTVIGYTVLPGNELREIVCDDGTVTESGRYFGCCSTSAAATATAPCAIPTACSGNSLVYPGGNREACGDDICAPAVLYEDWPSENLIGTQVVCRLAAFVRGDRSTWTYYRNAPTEATLGLPRTTPTPTANSTDAFPESTPSRSGPTGTNPDTDDSENPDDSDESPNIGLIAGAAAGGAAVVGLIGLAWFCIARRRSNPAAPAAKKEERIPMNKPAEKYYPPMYAPQEATEMQHFDRSELDGPEKRAELGHYGQHGQHGQHSPYGQYGQYGGQYGHSISEMSSHHEHQIVELEGSGPLKR